MNTLILASKNVLTQPFSEGRKFSFQRDGGRRYSPNKFKKGSPKVSSLHVKSATATHSPASPKPATQTVKPAPRGRKYVGQSLSSAAQEAEAEADPKVPSEHDAGDLDNPDQSQARKREKLKERTEWYYRHAWPREPTTPRTGPLFSTTPPTTPMSRSDLIKELKADPNITLKEKETLEQRPTKGLKHMLDRRSRKPRVPPRPGDGEESDDSDED